MSELGMSLCVSSLCVIGGMRLGGPGGGEGDWRRKFPQFDTMLVRSKWLSLFSLFFSKNDYLKSYPRKISRAAERLISIKAIFLREAGTSCHLFQMRLGKLRVSCRMICRRV